VGTIHLYACIQMHILTEIFATFRDNWGWKKLFQLIPAAGILFGAWINRGTLKDVGEAAKMLYRKRRILERLHDQVDYMTF
jgi:hypothetical protein